MAWTAYSYNSLNGYCGNCSIVLSGKIPIMIENKKVITWSLIVLFLSLSIVYSLTYQKKESLFKASIVSWSWDKVTIQNNSGTTTQWLNKQEKVTSSEKDQKNSEPIKVINLWGSIESNWGNTSNIKNTKRLPWTTEYFGTLDIVGILWQKPEFTLQDSKWNYFAYYGSHLNFIQTVQTLGGNVYEMVTESEILQNQLFGDRVSYINLSMFKDIWVLMVIEIDGDVWLLQIPADKYHYSKDYLKSLFIQ